MTTYTIVGPYPVANREPGATLTAEDLDGLSISHLIAAGHIVADVPTKPRKSQEG